MTKVRDQISNDMLVRILRKAFSIQGGPNKFAWKYDYNGLYTVKSTYQVLVDENYATESQRMPQRAWKMLWDLKLSFKLIVFL